MSTTFKRQRYPRLSNGSSPYGAQMGRRNIIPADYSGQRLRLTRLPFVDGAYDRWGAYWGSPANIWCAWGETDTEQMEVFVRADSRQEAKEKVIYAILKGTNRYAAFHR